MKLKKETLAGLLILLAVLIPLVWLLSTYHVVEFRLYPKATTELDLRGQAISVTHYEKLREKLPEAVIRWDVPFQGGKYPNNAESMTVTDLTEQDIGLMVEYFPNLKKVDAVHMQVFPAISTVIFPNRNLSLTT